MAEHTNIHTETIQLYEVIRVTEGIPIFLEDHLDRLYESARLTGMNHLPGSDSLTEMIKNFITTQKRDIGNIKLSFSFDDLSSEPSCDLNFIPHSYPSREQYQNGVKVGLLNADRPIPNAKVQNSAIRERANQAISDNDVFEVLLIDSEGNITEGSRSNVFFIKNETLLTSPGDKVLRGITWIKVLQICKTAGVQVIETAITANTLDQYEAAFLTGTSPKLLPICSINQLAYKTDHHLLTRLLKLYNQLVEDYLREKR